MNKTNQEPNSILANESNEDILKDNRVEIEWKEILEMRCGELIEDKKNPDELAILIKLDSQGILLSPNETIDDYKDRIKLLFSNILEFNRELKEKKEINLFDAITLKNDQTIPSPIIEEAGILNKSYYEFEIDWVPGFFISQHLGMLWGGCAITFPENNMSIFLIRANFAKKIKWLFYKRDELLAHELCQIARSPLHDPTFEEHFAYRLSPSGLRRYMGNCFQHTYDAIFFIIPFFLLLTAQVTQLLFKLYWLPIFPFWILIAIYPSFLLIRNQKSRNKFFKAKKALESIDIKASLPILFRSTKDEINKISTFTKNDDGLKRWLTDQAEKELRWKVINRRFVTGS